MYVFPPLSLYFILSEFSTFIHPFIHLFFSFFIAITSQSSSMMTMWQVPFCVKIDIRKKFSTVRSARRLLRDKTLAWKFLWKILRKRRGKIPVRAASHDEKQFCKRKWTKIKSWLIPAPFSPPSHGNIKFSNVVRPFTAKSRPFKSDINREAFKLLFI